MNYWLIFLTGLTTGGISCIAVQGGLLAAILANQKAESRNPLLPTLMFLGSKIVAYTLLGGLLGYFGSLFQISTQLQILFMVIVSIVMLGLVANMLEIHPIFRHFVIQPPKWAGRLLRDQSKSQSLFAPAIMGALTVLIPCGVTQGMQVLAIGTGNPLAGAMTMGVFTLGTSPLFLIIGMLTTKLTEVWRRNFMRVAAVIVLFISLTTLNSAMVLSGSKYSADKWMWAFRQAFASADRSAPVQSQTVKVLSNGYTPRNFSVKVGELVTLNLVTKNNYSCTSIFAIPELGISRELPPTGSTEITFTPTKKGLLTFACGMGMYGGTIEVI